MMKWISVLPLLLMLTMAGCLMARLENSARLMEHPEFPAAAHHAPAFTAETLKTINALEERIEAGE
jgi:hypothetical protein